MLPPRTLLGAGLALALGLPPLSAIVDRNADGLSDVWAALYHPTKGAASDEDGDGFTNAQEALAGTDPRDAASRFAASPPQTDAAGNLVLRWRGAWGKRYTVQSSADLKTWTALPELHIGRGGELSVIVRAAGAVAETRRYWRVVVADVDTDDDGMTSAEEIELGSDPTTKDATMGTPRVYGAEYFVSPTGSDANAGTKAAPFLTLEKAKAEVRTKVAAGIPAGGIAVWLRGGVYERTTTLEFTAADSGTSAANSVDWRGYPGEEARLVGGKQLPASAFALVSSTSPVWSRLDATARGQVLQLDLKAQGVTNFGTLRERGYGKDLVAALELFIDGEPQRLARWPDVDEHTMPDIEGSAITVYSGTSKPAIGGIYRREAVPDGQLRFKRDGLVGGEQFYLYRYAKISALGHEYSWYIAPAIDGQPPAFADPSGDKVAWACKGQFEPGRFDYLYPQNSGAGSPTVLHSARIKHGYAFTASASSGPTLTFTYGGERPARWTAAPDAWVDGYWSAEWQEEHRRIASIDTAGKEFTFASTNAVGINRDQPWFAYNLLEEITRPGEWYLDRASGVLYLWPPAGFGPASEVVVSQLEEPLLKLDSAKYVGFVDLSVEAGRGRQVHATNTKNGMGLSFLRTTFRNAGDGALRLENVTAMMMRRCRLLDCGAMAMWLSGGDRKQLVPAGNVIEDCEFARFGRFETSGVRALYLEGCGSKFRHNRVSDGPDQALNYMGNNHEIEANDFGDLGRLCGDTAVIYTGGWEVRGNTVHGNFIHDVDSALFDGITHGVYVDDGGAGADVQDNFFYRVDGAALFFNGGPDNIAERNLVVRCHSALRVSTKALAFSSGDISIRVNALLAVGYRSATWSAAYPECTLIPNTVSAIEAAKDTWLTPRRCVVRTNFGWSSGSYFFQELSIAQRYFANGTSIVDDNTLDSDPRFVDEEAGDLNLRADSTAKTKLGWTTNPFKHAGIRE